MTRTGHQYVDVEEVARRIRTLIIGIATLALPACATTSQHTSGADYLARYNATTSYQTNAITTSSTAQGSTPDIDREIKDIASVEPHLQFPARIGLARIERGNLISVPQDEASYWQESGEELGHEFGQFIPVSPLVAEMVGTNKNKFNRNIVNHIRRGAARQHLDYVIAYEVLDKADSKKNTLSVTDLSVLGLFVLPSRDLKIESTANAILLDVRNGYPYLTGSTFADKKGVSTLVGRGDKKDKFKDAARSVAVDKIADEFAMGLKELKLVADGIELAEKRYATASR